VLPIAVVKFDSEIATPSMYTVGAFFPGCATGLMMFTKLFVIDDGTVNE
jgi:hypothetical protein